MGHINHPAEQTTASLVADGSALTKSLVRLGARLYNSPFEFFLFNSFSNLFFRVQFTLVVTLLMNGVNERVCTHTIPCSRSLHDQ